MVVVAVVLQTTLFGDGRIQPFGASPNLVVVVVIATVRHLDTDAGLLVGFTAGLLMDLLGGAPLGLWAMVMTVIAYLTLRLQYRTRDGALPTAVGIFALTFLAHALFVLTGTLFGQRLLANLDLVRLLILPAVYNVVLAAAVMPLATRLMGARRVDSWAT
jgi:rod shape-determining protein MreD